MFGKPQPDLADPWYDLRLCGTGDRSPDSPGSPGVPGFGLRTLYGLEDLVGADTKACPVSGP